MLIAYFSPWAPAAALLLCAFILPLIPRFVNKARLTNLEMANRFRGVIVVGLVILVVLTTRLDSPTVISQWAFPQTNQLGQLIINLTATDFSLVWLTVWLLLIVVLARTPLRKSVTETLPLEPLPALWLYLTGAACLVLVAANELTLSYAILIFDSGTAIYWFRQDQHNLGMFRLLLAGLTAIGFALAATITAPSLEILIALVIWLRLVLLPFIELTGHPEWLDEGSLLYFGVTLIVGVTVAQVGGPPMTLFQWLTVGVMGLNGLLIWLSMPLGIATANLPLERLVFVEVAFLLLIDPLPVTIMVVVTIGLVLSLAALWVTPRLGPLSLTEARPYLPAAMATITLLGLPFSLGWLSQTVILQSLFRIDNGILLILAILIQGFTLSGLWLFWQAVWEGPHETAPPSSKLTASLPQPGDVDEVSSSPTVGVAGWVAMIPFLIPGLGPISWRFVTQTGERMINFDYSASVYIAVGLSWLIALGLGYFQTDILARLQWSPGVFSHWLTLRWVSQFSQVMNRVAKMPLRLQIILEGQHYLGWMMFVALVGTLTLLLSR